MKTDDAKGTHFEWSVWFQVTLLVVISLIAVDVVKNIYAEVQKPDMVDATKPTKVPSAPVPTEPIHEFQNLEQLCRDVVITKPPETCNTEPTPSTLGIPKKSTVLFGIYILLAICLLIKTLETWEEESPFRIIYFQGAFLLFFLIMVDEFGIACSLVLQWRAQAFRIVEYIFFLFYVCVGFLLKYWTSPYST